MTNLLRLCDEDREQFPGGPEWLRWNEADLDDVDGVTLAEYESSMNVWFSTLYAFDKPRNTIRWQMCQVWLARRLAGVETPDLHEFRIKIRKVEWKDEPAPGDDVDPPDPSFSKPSSAATRSRKRSR
ncbi:MAG TPA: hypothetical protein VFC19_49245 [Candidatus Limnocylindrales bacterium]|nr:hypothetical protein [Candidatus Limnocylindrales bacterium]